MPSDFKFDPTEKKNTNGQKSTKQNLIDRHTLLLSVTEYIIYATQCQFCELFADYKCVYVCLFVRISVDTTVIIKKMSLPIQTTTNL